MRAISLLALLGAALQAAAAEPKFETASVKIVGKFAGEFPARGIIGGPGTPGPGRIEYREQSLKDLLFLAYRVQFYQLRTPSWMEGAFFTVQATVPPGSSRDDVSAMLRNLLVERFRLRMRREPKEMKGYVLKVGANGPRFTESPQTTELLVTPERPAGRGPGFNVDKDGFMVAPPGVTNMLTMPPRDGVRRLTAARASMEVFCGYLGRQFQQPVVDRTGLPGIYDFRLAFAPEVSAPGAQLPVESSDSRSGVPQAPAPVPTLAKAVEEQLGLKLEARTVRTDTLVIEHIERTPIEQ